MAQGTAGLATLLMCLASTAALAQNKGDAARPTFQDDRRWTPKPEPTLSAPAPAAAGATAPQMTTPADPSIKQTGNASCGLPATKATALEAGRMRVVVTSSCRAGQEIAWTYGGAEFQTTLDGQGRQEFIVDAFAGISTPVEIKFTDDTLISLPVEALGLDRLAKIAVIWRAPVELGLHAFEYAALPGDTGHISAATPSSLVNARESNGGTWNSPSFSGKIRYRH